MNYAIEIFQNLVKATKDTVEYKQKELEKNQNRQKNLLIDITKLKDQIKEYEEAIKKLEG